MTGYFPNADWMDFTERKVFKTYNPEATTGTTETFDFDYSKVNLYLRGGHIIPYQKTDGEIVYNTYWLHKIKTDIIIQPDSVSHVAKGQIVFDNDGNNTIAEGSYNMINMNFEENKLTFTQENLSPYNDNDFIMGKVQFWRMKYFMDAYSSMFYAQIEDIEGNFFNISPKIIDEDNFDVDLSKLNLAYSRIKSVTLLALNNKQKLIE